MATLSVALKLLYYRLIYDDTALYINHVHYKHTAQLLVAITENIKLWYGLGTVSSPKLILISMAAIPVVVKVLPLPSLLVPLKLRALLG